MLKKLKFLSLISVLMICFSAITFGQETTGTIEGRVTDSQEATIPGATVKISGGTFNRTVTVDENGEFRVLSVPPGTYTLEASATNFSPVRRDGDVTVVLGKATTVNFQLAPGSVSAEITVTTDNTPLIDTADSKTATNITAKTIELLPKSPNFTSLLTVSPSVRNEPNSGGFQIDGASGSENTFIIDGQEVTNFRTGTLNSNNNIPTQFVQEIQVKTGGFEAEYGGATGGVINVVTKGGSNDFRGEIGFQIQPSKFQATPRLIQSSDPETLRYLQPAKLQGTHFFPNVTFQGPIVKDRVWFFTSHVPQFRPNSRTFTFADGSEQTYTQDERQDYSFVRVDAQVAESLRVYSTYTYNPLRRHGVIPATTQLDAAGSANNAPSVVDQFNLGGRQAATSFTVAGSYVPTSRLVIDARFGRSYLNENLGGYGVPNQVRYRCITAGPQCSAGFSDISTNFASVKDISIRKTFDVTASYILDGVLGRHQFKGGYQLNDISNDVEQGYVGTGETRLFFGRTFPDLNGNPRGSGPGEIGYGYLQRFGTSGVATSRNEALFIQDKWQPISRLTLDLGIRIERENVPAFNAEAGGIPLKFDFADKLAPRLGASFDVLGNGKWKISGSFGRFYDRFKYELPRGSFGGDIFLRDYYVILASNPSPFFYTRAYSLANAFRQNNFRVASNTPGFVTVDPDLKAVRQTEYNIGTEFTLFGNFALRARYLNKILDRTIEDVGIPDAFGNETYFIANPGFGIVNQIPDIISGVPATPKAERDYKAFEIALDKRFSNNYYFNASYTLSRLYGNYGGLANSDEGGRTSPNVNRVFDLPFEPFTASGKPNNGRLATDRPHVFKLFAGYELDWRRLFNTGSNTTTISGSQTFQSGTPVTSRVDLIDVATVVLNERGDLGRTEMFRQTDFALTHTYKFGRDNRFGLAFDLDILNLLDDDSELGRMELITGGIFAEGVGITRCNPGVVCNEDTPDGDTFFTAVFPDTRADSIRLIFNNPNGARAAIQQILDAQDDPDVRPQDRGFIPDARYNSTNQFQVGRSVRFGFRFIF